VIGFHVATASSGKSTAPEGNTFGCRSGNRRVPARQPRQVNEGEGPWWWERKMEGVGVGDYDRTANIRGNQQAVKQCNTNLKPTEANLHFGGTYGYSSGKDRRAVTHLPPADAWRATARLTSSLVQRETAYRCTPSHSNSSDSTVEPIKPERGVFTGRKLSSGAN